MASQRRQRRQLTGLRSNIWDTGSSADIVKVIGTKYAFSQRLISLMINATLMKQRGDQFGKKRNLASRSRNRPQLSMETGDPEMGLSNDPSRTSTSNQAKGSLPLLEGEEIQLYLLLKETVNYSSIDHTEKGTPPSRLLIDLTKLCSTLYRCSLASQEARKAGTTGRGR